MWTIGGQRDKKCLLLNTRDNYDYFGLFIGRYDTNTIIFMVFARW